MITKPALRLLQRMTSEFVPSRQFIDRHLKDRVSGLLGHDASGCKREAASQAIAAKFSSGTGDGSCDGFPKFVVPQLLVPHLRNLKSGREFRLNGTEGHPHGRFE